MPFATQWHAKHKLKLMGFWLIGREIAMQRRRVHAPFPINISGNINVFATQCHEYCGKFSMNEPLMMIILNLQCRRIYANIPMNVFYNINILMVQLGTSCSFDSPGLARNEPTPGKRSQGDSTL